MAWGWAPRFLPGLLTTPPPCRPGPCSSLPRPAPAMQMLGEAPSCSEAASWPGLQPILWATLPTMPAVPLPVLPSLEPWWPLTSSQPACPLSVPNSLPEFLDLEGTSPGLWLLLISCLCSDATCHPWSLPHWPGLQLHTSRPLLSSLPLTQNSKGLVLPAPLHPEAHVVSGTWSVGSANLTDQGSRRERSSRAKSGKDFVCPSFTRRTDL